MPMVLLCNDKKNLVTGMVTRFSSVMLYHFRFLNPRLKNAMCKSEFSVLF